MDSPTEKQLINVIQRLKTQMKDMQELFEAQDEEKHQEIQSLLKERKELKEKIELLETKISNSGDNFSSSLASTTSSNPTLFEHETTTITESGCCGSHGLSDSLEMMYVEDYEKLQESYQRLFDEKTHLEAKVHEMTSCLQNLQETAEELQQKSSNQQEMIQRLVEENQRLTFTNKDLYEAVIESEQQKDEVVEIVVAEPPKSLFDELKEAGAMEESFSFETIEEAVDSVEDVYENAKADKKQVELRQGKKPPRLAYVKKPLIRFLSVFSVFADYLTMAKLDQPILYCFYSDVFVLQTRPNIS